MREFSVPPLYQVGATANLTDVVHNAAEQAPAAALLGRKSGGVWRDVTAKDFLAEVTAVAKGIAAAGIEVGDRVALMSRTRYEWTLLDFALFEAGAVVVPVYETSSAEQVEWILSDSGAVAVFAETSANAEAVESARAGVADSGLGGAPDVREVWVIEPDSGKGAVQELTAAGTAITDEQLAERRGAATPESLASIIYTSGTTGRPKGCVLTHGQFLAECENVTRMASSAFNSAGSTLLFLPLAHVLARVIQTAALTARVKLGHCSDTKKIVEELGGFKPTFILSVPRVFEKVYNGASQKAHAEGKGAIFDKAAATAIAWSRAEYAGKVPMGLKVKHAVFDKLVYGKLRAALGGNATLAVSGGAPLGTRLVHFFHGIGLQVQEGYGLTETCAAITLNPIGKARPGTVGVPVPGASVRIAEDGEILVKGPMVFSGYYHNDAATNDAVTDGWFATGDLGSLDNEGYLSITGRKKEILVTAGGKNVAPAVLEDRINAHPLVNLSMVVGDKQPFIAALVTLDPESLPTWAAGHGKPAGWTIAEAAADPEVRAEVQKAVDDANRAVSHAEAIKKFTVLGTEWSVEGGQVTPSMKLKRNVVMVENASDVEELYDGVGSTTGQ
ncbi:long-chain fatty acid--CoA ligase [Catenulispora sp. NF23]|uniref:AMP-dependent synthetase/ligase n=1 Tax=Catenulispora pinistramenti TaxID=2705254 RepID=UPI001BA6DB85|nr:AMP-dependent synthetase/ligase [Catenulispora pinistramenti]MBS2534235.1 long-chain fatty acid--CoA ligase [Catenulispora pinistramenti]